MYITYDMYICMYVHINILKLFHIFCIAVYAAIHVLLCM